MEKSYIGGPLGTDEREGSIVKNPPHYMRYGIEPVTFILKNNLPFHTGNIVKYALRAGYKEYPGKDAVRSEIIDLEKARRYCELRIEHLKEEHGL